MGEIIAIIPVKKNSERVKNKNLILFQGQTLAERAVNKAIKCEIFDDIIVSSPSEEILSMFNSVSNFKEDRKFNGSVQACSYLVNKLRENGREIDVISIIQPVNLFSDWIKIKESVIKVTQEGYDLCRSVVLSKFHKAVGEFEGDNFKFIDPFYLNNIIDSNDSKQYTLVGSINTLNVKNIPEIQDYHFKTGKIYAFVVNAIATIEIDFYEDTDLVSKIESNFYNQKIL